MFLKIVDGSEKNGKGSFPKLTYYLKRHIELDGDDHGPLALKMMEELCGDNLQYWEEVLTTSKAALKQRIALWDAIADNILQNKSALAEA